MKVVDGTPTYYAYNEANQLLTETTGEETVYYSYDGCGNTIAKQEAAGITYYVYDVENLMTRIDFPDDGHSYYSYDADSKRVDQRTPDGFREFVYQGPDCQSWPQASSLQLERDESEETVAHYTMGSGLEAMRRDSTSSFYHFNHLGTALALTAADGAVTDTYRHDAWGVLLASTGATVNPHTYVGRERYYRMPNADLYHLGFRDYAQRLGRFMTVDPVMHGELAASDLAWPSADFGWAQEAASRQDVSKLRHVMTLVRRSIPAVFSRARVGSRSYTYARNLTLRLTDPLGLQPGKGGGTTCEDARDAELDTALWVYEQMKTKTRQWEQRALQECRTTCRKKFPPTPGDFAYISCVHLCESAVSIAADIWRAGIYLYYAVSIALVWARYAACIACKPISDELAEIIRGLELMLQDLRAKLGPGKP
ncbi:MAG: hypothetical protein U9R79_14520 [Armatimonadota bacterium]|nr:hypothetical protein [Armatimonadota bacterium]